MTKRLDFQISGPEIAEPVGAQVFINRCQMTPTHLPSVNNCQRFIHVRIQMSDISRARWMIRRPLVVQLPHGLGKHDPAIEGFQLKSLSEFGFDFGLEEGRRAQVSHGSLKAAAALACQTFDTRSQHRRKRSWINSSSRQITAFTGLSRDV
ncbi:hypothetical protein ACFWBV_24555 [Streptomyces sp. NPDC060030]|uniref:hypothetical protein n=1 Tax=Streptomyces sp. NPDC060030 TaxID=3347042 RepID=UPI0036BE94C9